jgi:hypothetical protein
MLQGVEKERSQLIDFLQDELINLREAAKSRGLELAALPKAESHGPNKTAPAGGALRAERPTPLRLLTEFFSPLSESELHYFHELNEHIGKLRIHCQNQLRTIEQLHGEAASCRRMMEADGITGEERSLRTKG